jgi:hypothetical protein
MARAKKVPVQAAPQFVSFAVIDTETGVVLADAQVAAEQACSPEFHRPDNTDTDPMAYYEERMAQNEFQRHPDMGRYRIPDLTVFVRTDGTVTPGDVYDVETETFTPGSAEAPADRPWSPIHTVNQEN